MTTSMTLMLVRSIQATPRSSSQIWVAVSIGILALQLIPAARQGNPRLNTATGDAPTHTRPHFPLDGQSSKVPPIAVNNTNIFCI